MPHDKALDIHPGEAINREHWVNTAVGCILSVIPHDFLKHVVMRGESEFFKIAHPIFEGHAFRREDYRRMFEIVRHVAEENISLADFLERNTV